MRSLRAVYGPAMLNGPFAIVLGFNGGMVALNDRIKLRPLVAAQQGTKIMVASEESAMREVLDAPDRVWAPKAGEPVIARVKGMDWPIHGDQSHSAWMVSEGDCSSGTSWMGSGSCQRSKKCLLTRWFLQSSGL